MTIVIDEVLSDAGDRRSKVDPISRKGDQGLNALTFEQALGDAVGRQRRTATGGLSGDLSLVEQEQEYLQALNAVSTGLQTAQYGLAAVHQEIPVQFARKAFERNRR